MAVLHHITSTYMLGTCLKGSSLLCISSPFSASSGASISPSPSWVSLGSQPRSCHSNCKMANAHSAYHGSKGTGQGSRESCFWEPTKAMKSLRKTNKQTYSMSLLDVCLPLTHTFMKSMRLSYKLLLPRIHFGWKLRPLFIPSINIFQTCFALKPQQNKTYNKWGKYT